MAKFVVAAVDEIPPGGRKIVEVAGRMIGVFNVRGEYFAVLNRCPHQGGPLCAGNTLGFLRSAGVGEFEYSRPGEVLRCPWHGWEYDLRTGQSWFDPGRVMVRRYEVTVEPGARIVSGAQGVVAAAGEAAGGSQGASGAGVQSPRDVEGERAAQPTKSPPEGAHEAGMEGLEKGPYVAETYPVSVEQEYVVVEIGR